MQYVRLNKTQTVCERQTDRQTDREAVTVFTGYISTALFSSVK